MNKYYKEIIQKMESSWKIYSLVQLIANQFQTNIQQQPID
jgi:hypothetical protein